MRLIRAILLLLVAFGCAALEGCFRAPTELKDAVNRQHQEIVQIRTFYGDAINKLFGEIETLQLNYVNQFEKSMIDKYKFKRGAAPGTTDTDDDLNVLLVPIATRIHSFADDQRAKVRQNIANMKNQYLTLNQSIDNVDEINRDLSAYIDSLIRYRKAQDALGDSLKEKVQSLSPVHIPSVASIEPLLRVVESEFDNASKGPAAPNQ